MSINHIVKRLRESRLQESKEEFSYVFDVPWRESIETEDDSMYHYNVKYMDYASEIMSAAKEDFDESDLAQYARTDSRTADSGILSMTMDFTDKGNCEVTVLTKSRLGQEQIDNLISYLTGQMSDGWGEGFEQREVASFSTEDEEWVEGYDDEEGYYDTVDRQIYVYGQFWWGSTDKAPYQITLVKDPDDVDKPIDDSMIIYPRDDSDRDNSEYNKSLKDEESKHPYVGRTVKYSQDGKTYKVTGAYDDNRGTIVRCQDITMKPGEYKILESISDAEFICKEVLCDDEGVIEILCYDTVEDEDFTKYVGHVDSDSARKSARLLLRDWKFEVPKDIKNELISTFGLEDYGFQIEESVNSKAYYVIDHTDGSEKYRVDSLEAAEEKKKELISQGSEEEDIEIYPEE